jgi:hypothetical protein
MTAPAVELPTYRDLRRRAAALLMERGEWAGCPIPVDGLTLHIEPTYRYPGLDGIGASVDDSPLDASGLLPGERLANSWYSRQRQAYVYVVHQAGGRAVVFTLREKHYMRRLELALKSMQACWAHDSEADMTATVALAQHVSDEKLTQYMLLGQFIETSPRSGVTYVFRRARPTVAMRATEQGSRVLAVLCMHPIAYYRETHVGAMTPTDDVLAHLLLMRGDEQMFWRRCNQHDPEAPEAAL